MCNGEFMNKDPEEAWDYLDMLAENAQTWDTSNKIERPKITPTAKGGMYLIKEDNDVNIKITNLTKKVEAIELNKINVGKAPIVNKSICKICESDVHITKEYPAIPAFNEVLHEQANFTNSYKEPFLGTYNPSWQNHPNFS